MGLAPSINGSKELKAFHAGEVPYVFGNFKMFSIDVTQEDLTFSQLMMEIWTILQKLEIQRLKVNWIGQNIQ